jgi:hypothetical protein
MIRRTPTGETWGRGRLFAILACAVAAMLLLICGLGLGVYYTLHPTRRLEAPMAVPPGSVVQFDPAPSSSQGEQDAVAVAPMPTVALDESRPSPVSTRAPGVLVLPSSTATGAVGVPTGFAHTPAGALAQLAAIDQTAMQTGTLDGVRAVIAAWAAPGGPTASSWSGVAAMAGFLDAAGLSGGGTRQLSLVVTPLMGLVKGTVGADFVVPCVDFEFDATLAQTERVAVADCQRMVWQGNRWVIGPGGEPAPAPSVWPDTDSAISVGFRDLRRG